MNTLIHTQLTQAQRNERNESPGMAFVNINKARYGTFKDMYAHSHSRSMWCFFGAPANLPWGQVSYRINLAYRIQGAIR